MRLDELIDALPDVGLRLNNLFQLDDGRWQANVRESDTCAPFGRGATPVEALTAAIGVLGIKIEDDA